jgi:hypothetical protein
LLEHGTSAVRLQQIQGVCCEMTNQIKSIDSPVWQYIAVQDEAGVSPLSEFAILGGGGAQANAPYRCQEDKIAIHLA